MDSDGRGGKRDPPMSERSGFRKEEDGEGTGGRGSQKQRSRPLEAGS